MSEKVRGKNYTEEEKDSLLECIKPYKNIIQWPMTDKKSNERKAAAWKEIARAYNSKNAIHRDTKSLLGLYKHMKMMARKGHLGIKIDHFKTEDGEISESSMPSDEKVFPFMELHINDNVVTNAGLVDHDDQPSMDEMSYSNSNDVAAVKDFVTTSNLLRLDEKGEVELALLKTKRELALKQLEIAEVELQIKKTILEKERKALAQMSHM